MTRPRPLSPLNHSATTAPMTLMGTATRKAAKTKGREDGRRSLRKTSTRLAGSDSSKAGAWGGGVGLRGEGGGGGEGGLRTRCLGDGGGGGGGAPRAAKPNQRSAPSSVC